MTQADLKASFEGMCALKSLQSFRMWGMYNNLSPKQYERFQRLCLKYLGGHAVGIDFDASRLQKFALKIQTPKKPYYELLIKSIPSN